MKRFLINVYTSWCGEENDFVAIAESRLSDGLESAAGYAAYENFSGFSGIDAILEEMFPDEEEYTDEMFDEAAKIEGDYYGYSIEEWDETRDEEEWSWYELIYDESNGTEFVINKENEEI